VDKRSASTNTEIIVVDALRLSTLRLMAAMLGDG
jgi:hypothetical protein